jgi:hypothetical protein
MHRRYSVAEVLLEKQNSLEPSLLAVRVFRSWQFIHVHKLLEFTRVDLLIDIHPEVSSTQSSHMYLHAPASLQSKNHDSTLKR